MDFAYRHGGEGYVVKVGELAYYTELMNFTLLMNIAGLIATTLMRRDKIRGMQLCLQSL